MSNRNIIDKIYLINTGSIYDNIINSGTIHDYIVNNNQTIKDTKEEVININNNLTYINETIGIINNEIENINTLDHLREAVMMRGYGGQDPLRAYTIEGLDMYENMLMNIDKDVTLFLLKAEVKQNTERKEVTKNKLTNDSDTTTTKTSRKVEKIGRNDPCPCGSGKKYKQCCGK